MPALSTISFFLLAALGLLLIPGPAVLYILTRSTAQGRRAGLASVGGIELASLTHAVAAAFGLSALLLTSALAFSVVKYLGAAYLIYLGARAAFAAREPPDTITNSQELLPAVCPGLPVELAESQDGPFLLRFSAPVCRSC